jgi:hypothetical protein
VLRRFVPESLLALVVLAAFGAGSAFSGGALHASLYSQGNGIQTFNGGGLTYGKLKNAGAISIYDLSPTHDMAKPVVTPGVLRTVVRADGTTFYRAVSSKAGGLNFKVSGSHFKIVITGTATLNGIGVYGRLLFTGVGHYQLDGTHAKPWPAFLSLGAAIADQSAAGKSSSQSSSTSAAASSSANGKHSGSRSGPSAKAA